MTNYTQGGDHTELIISSLHAHYQYQFTIAAETVQQGPFSNPVTVTTLEAGKHALMVTENLLHLYLNTFLSSKKQRSEE